MPASKKSPDGGIFSWYNATMNTQQNHSKKTVMIFGTFDVVHQGHCALFRQAREYGNHVIAVVARDATVRAIKGRDPLLNEQQRLENVAREDGIDTAVLGNNNDNKYRVIADHTPDIICLGYDQKNFVDDLRKNLDLLGLHTTQIIRLEPYKPEIYKSSLLNKRMTD